MTVTSGSVTIKKDEKNLIGISIGGGSPLCPCLYIVQIFDNTAASRDGTLEAGDEIVAVNGKTARGKTKMEVANMIQNVQVNISIHIVKLYTVSIIRLHDTVMLGMGQDIYSVGNGN